MLMLMNASQISLSNILTTVHSLRMDTISDLLTDKTQYLDGNLNPEDDEAS